MAFAAAFPAVALLTGRPAPILLGGAVVRCLALGVAHPMVARPSILSAQFRGLGAFLTFHHVMLLFGFDRRSQGLAVS
jgi:hypothetical protein